MLLDSVVEPSRMRQTYFFRRQVVEALIRYYTYVVLLKVLSVALITSTLPSSPVDEEKHNTLLKD